MNILEIEELYLIYKKYRYTQPLTACRAYLKMLEMERMNKPI